MFIRNCKSLIVNSVLLPVLIIGMLGVLPSSPVLAAVISVTNTNDSGVGSLRQSILNAIPGDTITFDPSLSGQTIKLGSTLILDEDLTIDGSALNPKIHISGDNSVPIFEVTPGATVTLNGLIIIDGWATEDEFGSSFAGGINNLGTLNIIGSLISNNGSDLSIYGNGGGIRNAGRLTITKSAISNNSAYYGAGIMNLGESLDIFESTISENVAIEGGGIYNAGLLNLKDSTVANNSARGGGIISTGTTQITNSTFAGNVSSSEGGGILSYGPLTVVNSTFSYNAAAVIGGAIYNGNGLLNLTNTILANSLSGGDCYNDTTVNGMLGVISHNLIEENGVSPSHCGLPALTQDPKLGVLSENTGATQTIPLQPGSPAINAGDDASCPATDQRGITRPQGSHCDLGAYEYHEKKGSDTTGVFRPSNGLLYLKHQNVTGFADIEINYGIGGDYPVVGDWDGNGTVTIGVYRNGQFYLRNTNTIGFADKAFAFGQPGDQPVAGDWDGDGIDTIGVYRNGTFFLRNSNDAGVPEMIFGLGILGDVGIAGDWDGNGMDSTGVFRPSNGLLYLKNKNETGFADIEINYGIGGDKPVTGDWNGDGIDTIGVYRNAQFYLRNSNTIGFADLVFALGVPGDHPIAGNWDGLP